MKLSLQNKDMLGRLGGGFLWRGDWMPSADTATQTTPGYVSILFEFAVYSVKAGTISRFQLCQGNMALDIVQCSLPDILIPGLL